MGAALPVVGAMTWLQGAKEGALAALLVVGIVVVQVVGVVVVLPLWVARTVWLFITRREIP